MMTYIIFSVIELDKVDFTKVLETSADTVRKSNNGLKTFVKWEGETPNFVSNLETKEGPYNYEEIIAVLEGSEWKSQLNLGDYT